MPERAQRPPYTSLAVLAFIALAIFVWTHSDRGDNRGEPLSEPSRQVFEKFGTLTDIAFLAEGGRSVKLSDFKGQPVVLNLWATWCAPCVEEMPSLDRLQRDFPGVAVIAVSLDKQGEEKVRAFFAENGLKHLKVFADPSMKALSALGIPGLPATILIASDGTEMGAINGSYDWDSADARAAVVSLLPTGEGGASATEQLNVRNRAPVPRSDGITEASFGK
jgi:thiol-disulfide isomerase/thioredoxin